MEIALQVASLSGIDHRFWRALDHAATHEGLENYSVHTPNEINVIVA